MSSFPLVSIITPSYNQAAFLEATIHSVLAQDYAPVEYLIVDGGSTDGSVEIIQRYADRLAWWVSERDSGQAEAINKGLQRARGEVVAWLNSDDLYLPGAISQAVAALQEDPELGMVFSDAITIDAQGKPLNELSFGDWGLLELVSFRIICQPAVFMRRVVLEEAGYLDRGYHFMLDHQLWIRMARCAPIRYIGALPLTSMHLTAGPWAAARHHAGAKNVAQAASFGRETMLVLDWMETQPDLSALINQNRRRVLSGAYRLNARYLLDDGLPGPALASYWKALINRPSYALKHWQRMAYALLCLLKLDRLSRPFQARRTRQRRERLVAHLRQLELPAASPARKGLEDWPGLSLEL